MSPRESRQPGPDMQSTSAIPKLFLPRQPRPVRVEELRGSFAVTPKRPRRAGDGVGEEGPFLATEQLASFTDSSPQLHNSPIVPAERTSNEGLPGRCRVLDGATDEHVTFPCQGALSGLYIVNSSKAISAELAGQSSTMLLIQT